MPKVTYRPASGDPIIVDAFADMTLMEVALCNDVPGIVGLCGGICSCATCHVYVDEEWADRLPAPSGEEQDMVEGLDKRRANSRLGCQVMVTDALDGLVVTVAEAE